MNKKLKFVLSIPKTLYVNFRYLPFKQAVKLPICISYDCTFKARRRGIVREKQPQTGMITIGFFKMPFCNHDKTIFRINGQLIIRGSAHFGCSSKVNVREGAKMIVGDHFNVSSSTSFDCNKSIEIGQNVLFGWDCLVMDSDGHDVYDKNGTIINKDKPIIISDHVWIGCRATILKGANIPSNSVISAGTTISGQLFEENSIIAGCPPASIKEIGTWRL